MRARVFLGFLTLLAPFLAAGEADAQPAQPLDRLLPQIRRNVPGQFLDAESANQDGNPRYHLKWLTPDGRVMWLDADARTGRVLGRAPGRDTFDGQRPRVEDNGGPPDRRDEGRGNMQRYERQDENSPEPRRQFRGEGDGADAPRGGFQRPERNFGADGERPQGGFGGRFERGANGGFGGQGFGNRPARGNSGGNDRGFGGGRDRRNGQ